MNGNRTIHPWLPLLTGFVIGAFGIVLLVAVVLVLFILVSAPLLVYLAYVLGADGSIALGLLGVLLAIVAGCVGAAFVARWIWRRFASWHPDARSLITMGAGALCTLALALAFAPFGLRDMASEVMTGHSLGTREPAPASAEAIQHMRDVVRPAAAAGDATAQFQLAMALLHGTRGEKPEQGRTQIGHWMQLSAAQPQGIEARLTIAAEKMATPVSGMGRMVTLQDIAQKSSALRALVPTLPGAWQAVALGTSGLAMQISGPDGQADDVSMRQALADAGRAGSRSFGMMAAGFYEGAAVDLDDHQKSADADIAWQQALQAYAQAGNLYETERLQRESLPAHLSTLAVPPPVAHLRAPDAQLSARLWQFAQALAGADIPDGRIPFGHSVLAQAAALIAIETAPDPGALMTARPANGLFAQSPRPLKRWLLALRHARGDCMAALKLSELTRSWESPPVVDADGVPVTPLDDAWSLAWAESAQRCARSIDDKDAVARRIQNLKALIHYETFQPGEVDNARAGVAATLQALQHDAHSSN